MENNPTFSSLEKNSKNSTENSWNCEKFGKKS